MSTITRASTPMRRVFAFAAGTGMLSAEGEVWRRHRRLLNPALDHRAVHRRSAGVCRAWPRALAGHLAALPADEPIDIGETFTHLMTAATGPVFAGDDREIDPVLYRLGQYPGRYRLSDFLGFAAGAIGTISLPSSVPLIDRLIAARRDPVYAGRARLLAHCHARDRERTRARRRGNPRRGPDPRRHRGDAAAGASVALVPAGPSPRGREAGSMPSWTVFSAAARRPRRICRAESISRRVVDETLRLYPPAPTMLRSAIAGRCNLRPQDPARRDRRRSFRG